MLVDGKSALVTGGARGIGRAIGEDLLKHGAKVCLADILDKELRETSDDLKSIYGNSVTSCVTDVADKERFSAAFKHTVQQFGSVDILVNNACLQKEGQWEAMLGVNLGGVIQGTLLALDYMKPNGGVVVNISSDCGDTPLIPVYTTSKAAVNAYTRCFALNAEVISRHVRMVCLCPRPTDTFLLQDRSPDKCWDLDTFYSNDRGPVMRPDEVATILLSLLQDESNNGKVALINGPKNFQYV